jgi:hypothetical protein
MNLKNLPNEAGLPLSEYHRVHERFRLTLRPYRGGPIFRFERWIEPEPGGLWICRAHEGLSMNPSQARTLAEGFRRGLDLIGEGLDPFSNRLW